MALQTYSRVADVARAKGYPTISALARAAQLNRATVRAWWDRTPERFSGMTLCKFCKTLDARIGDLIVFSQA